MVTLKARGHNHCAMIEVPSQFGGDTVTAHGVLAVDHMLPGTPYVDPWRRDYRISFTVKV